MEVAKKKEASEVRKYFAVASTGVHTVGGEGKWAGQQYPCTWFACLKPGCKRGFAKPIKQVGTATGDLFSHLDVCQPAVAQQLRARSPHIICVFEVPCFEARAMTPDLFTQSPLFSLST